MSEIDNIIATIKKHEIEFIDFRFTDTKGQWHHLTYTTNNLSEKLFKEGIRFDGSSLGGWKDINDSDTVIIPDLNTYFIDPFTDHPTLVLTCNVIDPITGDNYTRDPRSTALRAEKYLKETGIGDTAFFGPELEFFIFDNVQFKTSMNENFAFVDSYEGAYNSDTEYPGGNLGHRPRIKGGYVPVQPIDSSHNIRAEILSVLNKVGVESVLHHHEVAPSQSEITIKYDTLVSIADNVQKYKYVVHNVVDSFGKTATFMPKPVRGDNGSGMHVHQSIWKNNQTLFAGSEYDNLSTECLYYIGGIIKHARALNAFGNASTNSYKRLVPGFEAPVALAYSARNRSAAIRIPYTTSPCEKRIEVRFGDPSANPYLYFAALLMAGLDGIKNKIHPGDAIEKNLYDLSESEIDKIGTVSRNLRMSLEELSKDREFLKQGGVFNDDQIDAYIALKMEDVKEIEQTPHPHEFSLYYSV